MLNKNISLIKRKDKNNDNSRAEQMKRLIAALSSNPNNRRPFSNIRERPGNSILEVKSPSNRKRAFSPGTIGKRLGDGENSMKKKIYSQLDRFLKTKKPSKNTQGGATPRSKRRKKSKILSLEKSNEPKEKFNTKEKGTSDLNTNDGSLLVCDMASKFQDHSVEKKLIDLSKTRSGLTNAANNLITNNLDNTIDIVKGMRPGRDAYIMAKKGQIVRQNFPENGLNNKTKPNKMDNSSSSTTSQFSGAKFKGKITRKMRIKKKDINKDASICKVLPTEGDASIQTLLYHHNTNQRMDTEKDASHIKVDLEKIDTIAEEEIEKKVDNTDNQRYRKSLVLKFVDEEEEKNDPEGILQDFLHDDEMHQSMYLHEQERNEEDKIILREEKSKPQEEEKTTKMSGNYVKAEKRKSDHSEISNKESAFDFGEDFLDRKKKKCNKNNLLALLSNDDFTSIQQNIMDGLKKGDHSHRSSKIPEDDVASPQIEDSDDDVIEMDDEEAVPQSIFYQYKEKNKPHTRYCPESDEEIEY